MTVVDNGIRRVGKTFRNKMIIILLVCLSIECKTLPFTETVEESILNDFDSEIELSAISRRDVRLSIVSMSNGKGLRIDSGHSQDWPRLVLKAPQGKWNLERREYIAVDVTNVGTNKARLCCRVDNPGANGWDNCNNGKIELEAGKSGTLLVPFKRKLDVPDSVKVFGMKSGPFGNGRSPMFDPSNVIQLVVFLDHPKEDHSLVIEKIRAGGKFTPPKIPDNPAKFFPFIDEFGQYIHKEWPGKTSSLDDMHRHRKEEEDDLALNLQPADRNRYGGWAAGPKLNATGFFRVKKHMGKWWLVDPEGRLFWSHGIGCVKHSGSTPISGRERYFQNLPKEGTPFARFYGSGWWASHGYYKDHSPYQTYDFSRANLFRKYGADWTSLAADAAHRRLRSWGLNTLGNWSDSKICFQHRTAYVKAINFSSKRLASSKAGVKFMDVFDPSFRSELGKALDGIKKNAAGDPWCIGFFVHNELDWGTEDSLALATLSSPPNQIAKRVFAEDLKTKYGAIEALNKVWGTKHASWKALRICQTPPDATRACDDLLSFYTKTAETYFCIIREELKRVAPAQLYLGCRFYSVNKSAVRASAKFCDVVSFNKYTYSVEKEPFLEGIDMPTIIGEFHFGAPDRGMFHSGLKKAESQEHRAQLYEDYVRSALRNPQIVGTHWFKFRDQCTSGRQLDGENYQIGFVDICDTVYPEIVAAARRVGEDMYGYRRSCHKEKFSQH